MLLGDVFGNRQAQTGAVLSVAAVGAVKRGENMRQLVGFDARAVVLDFDMDGFAVVISTHLDTAAVRAVFHRIADNVVEGAVQVAFVAHDAGVRVQMAGIQGNVVLFLLGNRLAVFHHLGDEGQQGNGFFFHGNVGRFQARQG